MERSDINKNKKLTKEGGFSDSKLEKGKLELSDRSEKCRKDTEITTQVEMMTDSLLACVQMSKCRSVKRNCDLFKKTKTPSKLETSGTPTEIPEEPGAESSKTGIIPHVFKQDNVYQKFQAWNAIISQEVVVDVNPKNVLPKTSFVDENPTTMCNLIERELQTLKTLAPSATETAVKLYEWVSHYKACARCHEKISLCEILHRIQGLNLHIANKRQRTQETTHRATQSTKEKKEEEVSKRESSTEKKPSERQRETLEKFNAAATAEGSPGVEILLEVPEKEEKRFFLRSERGYLEIQEENSSVSQGVNGFSNSSAVHVKKKEIVSPKLYSPAVFFVFSFSVRSFNSVLALNCLTGICRAVTSDKSQTIYYPKLVRLYEKQTLRFKENPFIIWTKKIGYLSSAEELSERNSFCTDSNESSNLDPIKELLKEVVERMEFNNVEEEAAILRNLITEVQQSQIKLSKVLLREGVFSQPLIKLTNPNLLEEESKALKKISEIGNSSLESTSLEDLQTVLQNLKEKCSFKNRLIGTVTRGLIHNIPKGWWEEVVGCTFEGANILNEREFEKIDGLLRQCSTYFNHEEKALEQQALPSEEQPSEEDSKMNENSGMNAEESKRISSYEEKIGKSRGGGLFSDFDVFLDSSQPLAKVTPEKTPETWMRNLENQISNLSVENTKLWEEINALRDSLEDSMKQPNSRKIVTPPSNRQSIQEINQPLGKTINVTVQISSDKISRRSKDGEFLKLHKYNDDDGHSRTSKNSIKTNCSGSEYLTNSKRNGQRESAHRKSIEGKTKLNLKTERRRSQNDLNFLDDFSPSAPEQPHEFSVIPKEKTFGRESNPMTQQISLPDNRFSNPNVFNLLRGVDGPDAQKPSKSDGCHPGPSHKNIETDSILLQKPSLVKLGGGQSLGMHATMSNERELQPIMENDGHQDFNSSFCSSNSLCQAVQQLRARVRSIHKEVTVLKSKNDRIDKLLDRLLDDAVDNNKSFEEIENNLKKFNRLD